jgi:hypothetical protein
LIGPILVGQGNEPFLGVFKASAFFPEVYRDIVVEDVALLCAQYRAERVSKLLQRETMLKMGYLCSKRLFGERRGPRLTTGVLVRFHEDVDGFLTALGANLQVVSVVRERLFAPLAPFDTRGLHLRNFFEQ